jgi:hypothetical protein
VACHGKRYPIVLDGAVERRQSDELFNLKDMGEGSGEGSLPCQRRIKERDWRGQRNIYFGLTSSGILFVGVMKAGVLQALIPDVNGVLD